MLKCKGYIMDRQGLVNWQVHGPNHCGTTNHLHGGEIPIRFRVRLYCENSLDEHGFLIDNMAILHFMEEEATVPTALSCEQLMAQTAERLEKFIQDTEPTLRLTGLVISFCPEPYKSEMTQVYGQVYDENRME